MFKVKTEYAGHLSVYFLVYSLIIDDMCRWSHAGRLSELALQGESCLS